MSTAFNKEGLARMRRTLAGHVEGGNVPGMVSLVSHRGETHVDAFGTLAAGGEAPMQRDTIFRIASLTKPITAVAAMILIEECRMRLDDAIDPWLPELAGRRVLKAIDAELDDTVPAQRPITVRDVLTYRMGFGSVMAPPDTYPIQRAIREHRIGGDGPPKPKSAHALDEWLRRLGSLPLMAQPGERWLYNASGDVLGALVARVSGRPLGDFLRERLFEPLRMRDTGFHVPADKLHRLPLCYFRKPGEDALTVFDDAPDSDWNAPPPFESGAGGLVSTVDDCFAFQQMMLSGGRLGSVRILSPASVALMTTDQLDAGNRVGADIFLGDYAGWGLGVAVDIRSREIFQTPGRFGWTGGLGTTAYTDPARQMIGILFTQRMMDSPEPPRFFSDFWTLAYAAME
ncbi:serine hydrolase domain-containing protein [Niveibacterium sp. SC-1]|uniref:serine hydrolase domain-containing protein n=1 Tax=Niveibacterium sp. SC-1 TaxID=3135646 RepID=UPI00311FF73E